jgi:hypothetical protein
MGLVTDHTTLTARMFKLGLIQREDCQLCRDEKIKCTYCTSLSGMQKIQGLGLYVLNAQGSRKHDGEWPNKPASQYQAWRNIVTRFKMARMYKGSIRIYVPLGTIMEPLALFLLLLLLLPPPPPQPQPPPPSPNKEIVEC